MQVWQTTWTTSSPPPPHWQKPEGIFSLVTKPSSQDIKQDKWRFSPYGCSSLWQMTETKGNMIRSGKLRINNHRCWLPKPNSQKSKFKIYFHKCFSPASVNLNRNRQGEIVILFSWLCTLDRKLGDWNGKNSYFLLVCCWLSHISTAVSRERGAFQPFTVPSSSLETVQEEKFVSFYLFLNFWLGLCNERQINKIKANKCIKMYVLHMLWRNAGMSNSKRWLELDLPDHLNQRTIYFYGTTRQSERVLGF